MNEYTGGRVILRYCGTSFRQNKRLVDNTAGKLCRFPDYRMQFPPQFVALLTAVLWSFAVLLFSVPAAHADNGELLVNYRQIHSKLENSEYGIPIDVRSSNDDSHPHGSVYGIIRHPYRHVLEALTTAENWCDIVPQHLNIKACTYQQLDGHCRLTLYSGRKYYEEPNDSHRIDYRYQVITTSNDYFRVELTATDGPLGTSDYLILAEAVPLTGSSTFIHFSYAFRQGFWARLATNSYLATLGSDKVGFTVTGKDRSGAHEYIDGIRGILERNAIRYYFAIQSYLDTRNKPLSSRFLSRITNWFELTEKYPRQLRELDKKEYISYKVRERRNQTHLQKEIDATNRQCYS